MSQQEVVKIKQGMTFSSKEKLIIMNVFNYFKSTYPEKSVSGLVRRTSKATGCSEKSVYRFRKEEASIEGFKEPPKRRKRKSVTKHSRLVKYDENVRQGIRNTIYDLNNTNVILSLGLILKSVNGNEKLPNFSLTTLRRLLSDMGFFYEKEKNGKSVLVEKVSMKEENLYEKNQNGQSSPNSIEQNIPQSIPKNSPLANESSPPQDPNPP